MKPTVIGGIALIILGLLVWASLRTTPTDREKLLEASGELRGVSLPTVLGGVAIAAGVGLLVVGSRKG